MRWIVATVLSFTLAAPACASDWEKFYTPNPDPKAALPSNVPPEVLPSSGNLGQDIDAMFRRGFEPIGFSSFNSPNSKTGDAEKLAKKLKARYFMLGTQLTTSSQSVIPLTLPNTTTSTTNGTVRAVGSGGYGSATYSGTTTNYGTQTTYIPITNNRFDKFAIFFGEAPRYGTGISPRALTPEEVSRFETQRAFVVAVVRDGSPAYLADLLPGDVVLKVNGLPADQPNWQAAIRADAPLTVEIARNSQRKELTITVPPDWRPK
jgi:hypothetical protein